MAPSERNDSAESPNRGVNPQLTQAGWQSRYDTGKTGWDRGQINPMLAAWLARGILKPCRILVPGCGRGHEVLELASRGFDVTGIDFAPSAVAHVRGELLERGLTAEIFEGDLFAFDPPSRFDAVYEQTCLCALDPENWSRYEARLHGWLRGGGRLAALFMQSGKADGPPFHCDVTEMRRLFDGTRWAWRGEPERVEHPAGLEEMGVILDSRE